MSSPFLIKAGSIQIKSSSIQTADLGAKCGSRRHRLTDYKLLSIKGWLYSDKEQLDSSSRSGSRSVVQGGIALQDTSCRQIKAGSILIKSSSIQSADLGAECGSRRHRLTEYKLPSNKGWLYSDKEQLDSISRSGSRSVVQGGIALQIVRGSRSDGLRSSSLAELCPPAGPCVLSMCRGSLCWLA